ncbi:serine/threonine protein kinase [Minicystis rosea]|nr:serine/threonine protein kinase [Minicystis rosea]
MTTRPGAPVIGPDESASIGPTAMMPAIGHNCPSCHKANHPGVPHCVFCGGLFDDAQAPTERPPPVAPGPHAAHFAPPEIAAPAPRVAWTEGPHAPADAPARPHSDPPPPSRKAFASTDSEDEMAPPIADPLIGVVVAERYRIVEPLGRGGMGIVYKVEHIRIGKLLAMKLLTGELSRNAEVVRRFKQEALTVSKLSSPNTVQVFDFGVAEGLTYLVMELVTGEDLARVLRATGPMPFSRLGKVVIQVCNALAEAHQKGIIHRDVKPENVMLVRAKDNADVAKVLDFGLAKLREGADLNDVTSQGAIVGTPYFMSPEQIRGEPVDHRTDIYALGALMYRALTGHYPFSGPSPMSVFTKHLTEPPVPPAQRAPELGIPIGASNIVLKALAKDPAERYQKIEDLQADLVTEVRASGTSSVEALLDSGQVRRLAHVAAAIEATKAEIATRDEVERYERKLRQKRWSLLLGLAAVVLGGAAGATYFGLKLYRAEKAEQTRGREIEPNNTAAEATLLPFGTSISGHVGRRLDTTHGDRDFYAVDIPAPSPGAQATVALKLTPLPNFGICMMLHRQGYGSPLGQYCVGRQGRELSIPALRIDAGRHFFTVLQDLDPYGGPPVFTHENVSDTYTLTVAAAAPAPGAEVEPNDRVPSANTIVPGTPLKGTLAWTRDEDVFCVPAGTTGVLRFRVHDETRDAGAVLEATPLRGALEGAPVRIHTGIGKPSATDAQNPWRSEKMADTGDGRCLRLRLTNDPWSGAAAAAVPSGSDEVYTVEVERE